LDENVLSPLDARRTEFVPQAFGHFLALGTSCILQFPTMKVFWNSYRRLKAVWPELENVRGMAR